MTSVDLINLSSLIDDAKCFELIRKHRWPSGVHCTGCASGSIVCNGHDDTQPQRQRYRCKACGFRFDDLTDTVFGGRHQPLRVWVLCLYFMGLNLSNAQIAKELELHPGDVHAMTSQLRADVSVKMPEVRLSGEVEADEVYVVAGHKGNPVAVSKKAARDAAGGSRGHAGAARSRRKSRQSSA